LTARKPRFDRSVNYYQVLDVPFSATKDDVTRSYRKLMRLTHPDQFRDPDERHKAEERAKLLNAAYAVLSKAESRQEYDNVMRQTVMSEALLQRYTGSAPGRPSPIATPPRPPSPRIVRARKRAYTSAVWQLLVAFGSVVIGLMAIIIVGILAFEGIQAVF
jgi:curved DNA-binding protein CbpA